MPKKYLHSFIFTLLIFIVQSSTFAQQARQTILFNDNWKFYKGDTANANEAGFNDNGWRNVTLPHDWSIEGPFDAQWASATAYLPGGIGWYRKTFTLSTSMQKKNVYLYFDGVYKNSEVWINGHYLGKRPNGFIPFQYEITRYLNATGSNTVAVKVDHTEYADSRWYTGSGIYRNVYLIATNNVNINLWGVAFSTPQVSQAQAFANVNVSFSNHSANDADVTVKSVLINKEGKQVAQANQTIKIIAGDSSAANLNMPVTNPSLWSVDDPELYNLIVSLYVQGKETDDVQQQVGIRYFKFDKDSGFFLNGKNMKLKGVCIHDDAGALGVAVPEEAWERRLRILKEGGVNAVRLSHNPHADYMYNLCDRLGILVMDEAFDEWEIGKNKWITGWNQGTPGKAGYHEYFKEWSDRDLKDMVMRSRNHPSIIMWSIGNEIDYPNDPYTHEILNTGKNPQIYGRGYSPGNPPASEITRIATSLAAVVKQADTTRPVTAALAGVVMSNEVGYPEVLGVVGYNYQEFRYKEDHVKYPNRIIYGSENGMSLDAWKAVEDNQYIAGQFLWTGVDYMGEARPWPARSSQSGLIDMAGFTKSQYYFRQSLWSDKPMVYIGTVAVDKDSAANNSNNWFRRMPVQSWNYNSGDSITVDCYTNCDAAELFLNGKSLGKKSLSEATEKVITWNIVYQTGQLIVKAYKNGKQQSSDTLITAGEPYAIKASTDRTILSTSKQQLANVVINIVDKNGNLVYNAENEITVSINGPAKIGGLENGSAVSHEDYKANMHKALHGKLLAYIEAGDKTGMAAITVTSPGLKSQVINIQMK